MICDQFGHLILILRPPTNLACHLSWRKTGICGKLSQQRGGGSPIFNAIVFAGAEIDEDQKCSWGSKMKNKPSFFLITWVSQTGGPALGNFSHIIPFVFWQRPLYIILVCFSNNLNTRHESQAFPWAALRFFDHPSPEKHDWAPELGILASLNVCSQWQRLQYDISEVVYCCLCSFKQLRMIVLLRSNPFTTLTTLSSISATSTPSNLW